MVHRLEREFYGQQLILETGRVAGQADGAVTVQLGDTVILVTVCTSSPREGIDFFPLTVDYEERMYAVGRIPGSFFKRESRPSTEGTLAARMTDRAIRPLFPNGFRNEVQVVCTVLSADQENPPDILAMIGTSAALSISSIPFEGPISGSRIGYIGNEFIINPTHEQILESSLELIVASSHDAVVMVEAGAKELSESLMLEAIKQGQQANLEIISMIQELTSLAGVQKLQVTPPGRPDPEIERSLSGSIRDRLTKAIFSGKEKGERTSDLSVLENEIVQETNGEFPVQQITQVFHELVSQEFREGVLNRGIRPDGRNSREVRPINCEVGFLPRTHGSGIFTRGQTQVLSTVTLGSLSEQQRLDTLNPEQTKRFLHHYNFPPYSVGEVRRLGGPGRRELGHGALAERALEAVIPNASDFPYTIRLVSDCLSSNGSTSMGSICGSTLALMDAGVPISAPVAGIAMGLIMGEGTEYVTLTDIQGLEDHIGDMDFKVAGTAQGITALQMDIKVKGITPGILEDAMNQAKDARLHVLGKMQEAIGTVRGELSPFAPRMVRLSIPVDKIGAVIGPGGKMIRSIVEESGATVDVENDGTVIIGSPNSESLQIAEEKINALTQEATVGSVYTGSVTRLIPFGAFVKILPSKEGLVRLNEIVSHPIQRPEEEIQLGQEITVMVIEVDRMGRINLSRRAVLEGTSAEEAIARQANERQANPRGSFGPPRRSTPRPDFNRPWGDR